MSGFLEERTQRRWKRIRLLQALPVAVFLLVLALGWVPVNAGEAAPAPAEKAASAEAKKQKLPETVFELIWAGGPVMIPIGICSLLALGIAFERLLRLRRNHIAPPEFVEQLKDALGSMEKPNIQAAVDFCHGQKTTIAEVFRAGIARLHQGPAAIEKGIEDAGARAVHKMKRSLRPLSSIANLATLLGLLGTVYGLINAFQASTQESVGKADMLAAGIYVALVTTASGLTVGIPTLVVYLWFCSRVDKLVDSIDEQAIEFVEFAVLRTSGPIAPKDSTPPTTSGGDAAESKPNMKAAAVPAGAPGGAS